MGAQPRIIEPRLFLVHRSTLVTVQRSLNPFPLAFEWLFSASPIRFQMFDTSVPPFISMAASLRSSDSSLSVILTSGPALCGL